MNQLTVNQVAKLSGITVRTLHYYDHIGLLKPNVKTNSGYRYYNRIDLLRLQQILFYRQMEIPLKQIKGILDDPEFDLIKSLQLQRQRILDEQQRLNRLIQTIDLTIKQNKEKQQMIDDQDLFDGFNKTEQKKYRQEVIDRWGKNALLESEQRLKNLNKQQWKDLKEKGEEINKILADLMGTKPESYAVQKAIDMHCKYIDHFRPVTEPYYRALGRMYVEDSRFTAYYEKYKTGLAEFICKAIEVYCDNGMRV